MRGAGAGGDRRRLALSARGLRLRLVDRKRAHPARRRVRPSTGLRSIRGGASALGAAMRRDPAAARPPWAPSLRREPAAPALAARQRPCPARLRPASCDPRWGPACAWPTRRAATAGRALRAGSRSSPARARDVPAAGQPVRPERVPPAQARVCGPGMATEETRGPASGVCGASWRRRGLTRWRCDRRNLRRRGWRRAGGVWSGRDVRLGARWRAGRRRQRPRGLRRHPTRGRRLYGCHRCRRTRPGRWRRPGRDAFARRARRFTGRRRRLGTRLRRRRQVGPLAHRGRRRAGRRVR